MERAKKMGELRMKKDNNAVKRKISVKVIFTIIMIVFSLFAISPLLWMISSSMKVELDVFKFPIEWIPKRWNAIQNYANVWGGEFNFKLYYWNSIKVTVLTTIFDLIFSSLAAYGFAKINFRFKNQLFLLYLSTIMIPQQVTIVPTFMILRWLHLYNTHAGLILISSFNVFGVFLLKQYMTSIPDSLIESAKIDGANHFTIFIKIIVPIITPALATLAILRSIWTWNDYQNPLIFLADPKLFTIQLGMNKFLQDYSQSYSLLMVAAVSSIIPLIIITIVFQKYIVGGISSGAVKG